MNILCFLVILSYILYKNQIKDKTIVEIKIKNYIYLFKLKLN